MNVNHQDKDEQSNIAFNKYLQGLVGEWTQVLCLLGAVLIPIFFLLDYFTHPPELHIRFAIYRALTTILVLIQYAVVRFTEPGRWYPAHGYFFSFVVSLMIVRLTMDLGGFNSSYYAGLILVIMAVNMLLSWKPIHSGLNGVLVMILYVVLNASSGQPFDPRILVNNLYFLGSSVIITTAISWVRFKLVRSEYFLRLQLTTANEDLDQSRAEVLNARDALWGEMQLAKMIQTALLPTSDRIGSYEAAALMIPADVVGGDYYDIIETEHGEKWVGIGDVSGHGVDSGLIMMMAQTAIQTAVRQRAGLRPSEVLSRVNEVLKANIARLGTDLYMSMLLFRLEADHVLVAGKHTDVLLYRARNRKVQSVTTNGTWLGIADDLSDVLEDHREPISPGDILLLYTDGITEARNTLGEVYGEERLADVFGASAHLPLRRLGSEIFNAVHQFEAERTDDITILLLKKGGANV